MLAALKLGRMVSLQLQEMGFPMARIPFVRGALALAVLAAAGLLGWLGAGVVTGHYLRQTRPVER